MFLQIQVRSQPAQSGLKYDHVTDKIDQMLLGQKQSQKIERTCQIIYIIGQKIGTDSQLIGEIKTLLAFDFVQQFTEKGHILMPQIPGQKASVSKRVNGIDDKQYHHQDDRQKECQAGHPTLFFLRHRKTFPFA